MSPKQASHSLQVSSQPQADPLLVYPPSSAGQDEAWVQRVPLAILAQSEGYQEQWFDGSPVTVLATGNQATMQVCQSQEHLVISYQGTALALADEVSAVYRDAYTQAAALGYPHLLRTWNFIDRINQIEGGQERYQTFCVARYQVLEDLALLQQPNPAATAIGGHQGHNVFTFLFSQHAGQVVENQRQVSAWQYPKQYSPKQPRFSRAMQCGSLLLCSGTASVVGHQTQHPDDLFSQLNECLANVQALLGQSDLTTKLGAGLFRFYLRDRDQVDGVIHRLQAHQIDSFLISEGDICRENLLIECEAVFQ
ncbi:hypothetical protein [Marinicella meishanensis]|uniref:chorismate transformation enzyme, FkbO/Hyg5 family n=1 Tax=Marinicella meishanensis TaxID=2873263 RepID=UPI001CBEBC9A|nr:hypothetical protein [Marinicella sp. NBU2979]